MEVSSRCSAEVKAWAKSSVFILSKLNNASSASWRLREGTADKGVEAVWASGVNDTFDELSWLRATAGEGGGVGAGDELVDDEDEDTVIGIWVPEGVDEEEGGDDIEGVEDVEVEDVEVEDAEDVEADDDEGEIGAKVLVGSNVCIKLVLSS